MPTVECTKDFSLVIRESAPCNIDALIGPLVTLRVAGYSSGMWGVLTKGLACGSAYNNCGRAEWDGTFTYRSGPFNWIYYPAAFGAPFWPYTASIQTWNAIPTMYTNGTEAFGNSTGCGYVFSIILSDCTPTPGPTIWKGLKGYGNDFLGVYTRISGCCTTPSELTITI